jgi:hypothetical protein
LNAAACGCHGDRRVIQERLDGSVYQPGVNQGFITLDVYDNVRIQRCHHFGYAVRPAGMVGPGQHNIRTVRLQSLPDALVLGRDHYARDALRLHHPLIDMHNDRLS